MAVHDHSWPFLVLHCASWSFYICNIHILKRNETRAAYSGLFVWCWVETDNSLSSAWTELQIVPFVYLFPLFPRKYWVHFAVLSVSSLCTNEQSVADLATFNDRTDCNTSRNISGHICPAIGVFCSNSCLDMDYRSRHMLICVCMCVKTIIASRMGPVCQEHRRLQPGAQDKPNTEDSVPWCSLHSVESCDARGWCGMVVDGRWLVYRMLCAICDHSLSFMAIHGRSRSFMAVPGPSLCLVVILYL